MPIPSVLLPAPAQQTTPYLTSSPVASTSAVPYSSDEQTLHCSQCKRDLPLSDFPIRLINLQPYLVCLSHEWYWTEAKRAQHWAPDRTSSLQEVCDAFREIAKDEAEYDDRFMVDGEEDDLENMVERFREAGNWKIKSMTPRASRAKINNNDPPPPQTWLYGLREQTDPKKVNRFKLAIWFHREEGKYTMTLKPEVKKDRSERPWARSDKLKGKAVSRDETANGGEERSISSLSASNPKRPASPGSELSQLLDESAAAITAASILSRAQRDAQQMPPPPIPPRKKARRVEPSLVSPSLSRHTPTSTNSFNPNLSSTNESSTLTDSFAQLQNAWSLDNNSALTLPTPPAAYSHHHTAPFPSSSPSNPAASFSQPSAQPPNRIHPAALSLFEMLEMSTFDPPIIPLPPRPARPPTTHHHHGSNTNHHNRRESTVQTKTGKELEDAVAEALGNGRNDRTRTRTDETLEEEELDDSRGEEEDYEDSIPDDSSEEEEDEDERDRNGKQGGEDEDSDASSFFESSAEEYSEYGSGDEQDGEGEEEEEGEDWFAGFFGKQMPGMADTGQGDEDQDSEEEGQQQKEMGINENRGSEKPDRVASRSQQSIKVPRGAEQDGGGEEDEVDELDSSGEE